MRKRRLFIVVIVLTGGVFMSALLSHRASNRVAVAQESRLPAAAREAAYRANNLGVALLEQFKHREGAEQFERALKLDPQLALARINLAIALYNVPDAEAAAREAASALTLAPRAPQALYILALVARSRNNTAEAVEAFRRVLQVDAQDTGANVNLGQLYAQGRNYAEAERAFRAALASEPYNTTALYGLANVLLRSNQREEGQRRLQEFQVLRQSGAGTSLGTNYLEQGRYAEAVTSTGAEAGLVDPRTPEVVYTDATEGVLPVAPAPATRTPPSANARRTRPAAPEQYDVSLRSPATRGVATLFDFDVDGDLDIFDSASGGQRLYRNDGGRFVDVTANSGALASRVAGVGLAAVAGDYDNDAKPDLFVLYEGRVALYHNEGAGKFSDATLAAGIASATHHSISAAFADVDHDGDLDIFTGGHSDLSKASVSTQATAKAGELKLDAPPAPNRLLRNNGDGKFTDVTAGAKVAGERSHTVAVVPTDYDNRRDVDLLVVNYEGAPALYRNLRDGSFRDVAREVGLELKGRYLSAAAGDVNKDGFTDFFFGAEASAGTFALSDGQGRFNLKPAPNATRDASAAQFLDYDNDGLLDLLIDASGGMRVWRNLGNDWSDVSERAVGQTLRGDGAREKAGESRVLASGDLDVDGDTDLIVRDTTGRLRFARNDGGNRNRSLRVRLAGRVSNRSGVEAKVEMRAGSLWQKLEVYAASPAPAPADVVFGLGQREAADAVRVIWPSGTVQAETEFSPAATVAGASNEKGSDPRSATKDAQRTTAAATSNATLTVTELDRKPSSCPYLYTWNGERFEFITDFMGGGELGYWLAPGVRSAPDPDEYVRIRGDQLKARNGLYELRVTNELEEVLFVDKLQLVAVSHPEDTEVFPGEGLGSSLAARFQLFATRGARPPARATDEHGHDMLARISQLDRHYADDFALEPIRGYAGEHALTLDLKEGMRDEGGRMNKHSSELSAPFMPHPSSLIPSSGRTLLLLTGWTDYAFSSDNVAAAHRRLSLRPPALQVRDARGRWRTVIEDIGIPVGRPQTVVVDLTGKFLSQSREVRIVTNMRIYWDQILVDHSGTPSPTQLARLDPLSADLRWRGFSAQTSPDGREPFGYDYTRVSLSSPWKVFTGRYTREGDVRELVQAVDDMFVISKPGDELSIAFDASALAPLPRGWTRTFLLYADGYSKEMDINSASPEEVAPLPFHRMREYPYRWPETFPDTPAHLDYLERYNTRIVGAPLPELVTRKKSDE
ncbi:MAG TPA: FG-GAP-like repeat-containing protein [Pyrinomonadaceae bacterium]